VVLGTMSEVVYTSLLQQRISDAGLVDICMVLMGGVKVFIRCYANIKIMPVIDDGLEFFS